MVYCLVGCVGCRRAHLEEPGARVARYSGSSSDTRGNLGLPAFVGSR